MAIPVSILICTRNRASHLRKTLQSVSRVSIPDRLDPELIVVDNGSTDETAEVIRATSAESMPLRRVTEPTPGVARARNAAIQHAEGRLLLWLDDDVRVPGNWLHCMTRPILETEADAVAGTVELPSHLERTWMQPFHRTALASTESIDSETPQNIISANMAFDRAVLADVPGFDPELGPGSQVGALEDTLFSWQLRSAGYRIGRVTKTAVEHHFDEQRLTRDAFIRAAIARGKSLAYIRYHWLHYSQEDWTHQSHAYEVWRHPQLILAKRLTDWTVQRWLHWFKARPAPIERREFWTLLNAYSLRQYLRERTRPRHYKERGLGKIRGEQLPQRREGSKP
ncbi:glycosyltransferase family 2 protein [Salinibacter grassmerensis]|uniref:glycosyltransferase family 2 protein n=1 Tax=Salinibacter grassmerensis TaxID=3040353 RepID=UPI0021E952AC|nr:glycosyltransferase family A protein [Salinibacter grassmerensis]